MADKGPNPYVLDNEAFRDTLWTGPNMQLTVMTIPAGGTHALQRGGDHIMLMELTQPLTDGETVPLTFQFASAPTITVQAQVRQPAMEGMDHAAH